MIDVIKKHKVFEWYLQYCYRRQTKWWEVIFLHLSVILFTGTDTPLGPDTPGTKDALATRHPPAWDQTPPPKERGTRREVTSYPQP